MEVSHQDKMWLEERLALNLEFKITEMQND